MCPQVSFKGKSFKTKSVKGSEKLEFEKSCFKLGISEVIYVDIQPLVAGVAQGRYPFIISTSRVRMFGHMLCESCVLD